MMQGGGCENVGAQYSLPNAALGAGRDLKGVRKVVLDAVHKAQGQGCAPGILGVAIGGDRGSSYYASKEVLFDKIGTRNPDPKLAALEEQLTEEANQLGIGPMGFGGKTTVIDTKITGLHRLPASYFVTVSYMCWAYRRRVNMIISGKKSSTRKMRSLCYSIPMNPPRFARRRAGAAQRGDGDRRDARRINGWRIRLSKRSRTPQGMIPKYTRRCF
jgi:tartrate dehydratase alpha subunit/fumarate hydratase class I-like protein